MSFNLGIYETISSPSRKRFVDYLGATEAEFDDLASYFLFPEKDTELVRG